MRLRPKARCRVDLRYRVGERRLQARRRGDVLDRAASGADQMVVVPRELLGQLEPSELVRRDDAMHNTDLLEEDEVAIDAALSEAVACGEDLGDRERTRSGGENINHRSALRCEALIDTAQPRDDMLSKFGLHAPKCTVGLDGCDRALHGARPPPRS